MTNSPAHPLDPLTAEEIRQAAAILQRDRGVGVVGSGWRFASIELKEPGKAALAAGEAAGRDAIVVCWDRSDGQAYRAVVSLAGDVVTSWEHLPGQQPNMTVDEWHECDQVLRAHPALVEALARRGITDMSLVLTDMWAYGAALVPERYRGLRIGWSDVWYRDSPDSNPYAHHVTGLHPVVDLNRMTVLEIEDVVRSEQPSVTGEYAPALLGRPLREVAPLEISQPSGVDFTLDGRLLSWQNWQLRLGFNYREGLVLHQVGFDDGGRLRPVAHRMSFAEMFVPYRDASPDHYRRTAFDIGEWGLGFMTTSLELGCDCLGEIAYLDAVVHDSFGEPRDDPQRDLRARGGQRRAVEARRRADRRRGTAPAAAGHLLPRHRGQLRVPGVLAVLPGREHRVRGPGDRDRGDLARVRGSVAWDAGRPGHVRAVPPALHRGPARPGRGRAGQHGLRGLVAGRAETTRTAWAWRWCRRHCGPRRRGSRTTTGRLSAPGRWSTRGCGTAWVRRSGTSSCRPGRSRALLDPSSPAFKRAEVIGHTLWVTPYREDERWPCGDFPNLSLRDTGLPAWTAADRPIENTDVVLWYVFGIHHITRPEDWPVMPTDAVSFWLKPFGFFDRNPALDVPPSPTARASGRLQAAVVVAVEVLVVLLDPRHVLGCASLDVAELRVRDVGLDQAGLALAHGPAGTEP